MTVPEAAMDEDHFSKARENEVGRTRQVAPMESVTETHSMNDSTHDQFGLGVSMPNTRHPLAALGLGERIDHVRTIAQRVERKAFDF